MAPRKPYVRWLIAAAVLLLFVVLLVVLERALALEGGALWGLRIGFILLGLIAAGAIVWYLRPQDAEPVMDPGDDVLLTIGGARQRLPRGAFASRAMVLVVGPEGAAKTSLVMRSGGDPELLAGDAPAAAGSVPPATKTANVWAMQQAVVTELGGKLLTDAPRWAKVVRALRAPRVAAAVGKGDAAPRAAVICVPCDLFYAGGNGQQLEQLGQSLRQRMAEASRELGLAMPVYVMFTKMDRIPHFESWIGVFTKDELRAPLGATLPFDAASNTGSYAERLTPRLQAAFAQIVQSVSVRRVDVLGRDTVPDRRYGAYELPRELQKLAPAATSFLVELCRPTQLGVSPQLRGFYFVGARPVVVADVAQASSATAPAAANSSAATQVFRAAAAAAAPMAPPSAPGTTRKVPEWVFLDRFLRDVVLADTGAASVATGGVRVQRARRVMLGTAIAASLLLLTAVTSSWIGNRSLSNRVEAAAQDVAVLTDVKSPAGSVNLAEPDNLRRLEALRALLDTLRTYKAERPPLRLRFGLWRGDALYDAARPVWYEGFRKQLFAEGWGALTDSLTKLPPVPTPSDDYRVVYNRLAAYLITTSESARSTPEFLAPQMLSAWQRGLETDADVTDLARRQFEFYAAELPTGTLLPRDRDEIVVRKSRAFLARFAGSERIYLNMIADADKQVQPVKIPQTPGLLVTSPAQVTGAYTAQGATFMEQSAFPNFNRYAGGDPWVVGEATAEGGTNQDSIIGLLRVRYQQDYIDSWRAVVRGMTMVKPATIKDAEGKLGQLTAMASPLLSVLQTIAKNTDVDSATRAVFQPVHAVTPPAVVDKLASDENAGYTGGLTTLQSAIGLVPTPPVLTDTAATLAYAQSAQIAFASVGTAKQGAQKVASNFKLNPSAAPVASAVNDALLAPIIGTEVLLRTAAAVRPSAKRVLAEVPKAVPVPSGGGGGGGGGGGAAAEEIAALNQRGAALCSRIDASLTSKFPFNADATADATIADVKAILTPETGELWTFYNDRLAKYFTKSGTKYAAKAVGGVEISESFVGFFNKAAEVSDALFAEDPTSPHVTWNVSSIPTERTPLLILKNNGLEARLDKQSFKNVVEWPATSGRQAELLAKFNKNKEVRVKLTTGDWAIFRLVAAGDAFQGSTVTWNAAGLKDAEPVKLQFAAQQREAASVLTREWMGRMSCVARVTK